MKGNVTHWKPAFLTVMLVLAAGFSLDVALSGENSKLTIAYIADEIGRIEPCG